MGTHTFFIFFNGLSYKLSHYTFEADQRLPNFSHHFDYTTFTITIVFATFLSLKVHNNKKKNSSRRMILELDPYMQPYLTILYIH